MGRFRKAAPPWTQTAVLTQALEAAFMNCNVPKPAFDKIGSWLSALEGMLAEVRQSADPLHRKP